MKSSKDINTILNSINVLDKNKYYTAIEVLEILGISDTTLYKYINLGSLNKVKLMEKIYFNGSDLLQFIDNSINNNSISN